MPVTVAAPAKINLFLHVTGRREDGYHTLQSLIFFADIADRLTVKPATATTLNATGEFAAALPPPQDNLVMKAVALLRAQFPEIPPVAITLEKNLPVAAGIGGGSVDAAAAIRALLSLAGIKADMAAMQPLVQQLGAELPVCYRSLPALVEGIGEIVTVWPDLPQWGIVLVNPRLPLLTKDVFPEVREFRESKSFSPPQSAEEWLLLARETGNDLEASAMMHMPEIARILQALRDIPARLLTRMSGSGATCYSLFADKKQAQAAADMLKTSHPEWWSKAGGMAHGQ